MAGKAMNDLKYGKHIIAAMSGDYLRNAARSVSLSLVGTERLQQHSEFQNLSWCFDMGDSCHEKTAQGYISHLPCRHISNFAR